MYLKVAIFKKKKVLVNESLHFQRGSQSMFKLKFQNNICKHYNRKYPNETKNNFQKLF